MTETAFLSITIALLGIIGTSFGFFAKYIINRLDAISSDVSEMKPKVNALWEQFLITKRKENE